MKNSQIVALLVVIVIVLIGAAYWTCHLDKWLPVGMQKCAGGKAGFVGAYGRTPEMQNCLAYAGPGGKKHWSYFNRCMWV